MNPNLRISEPLSDKKEPNVNIRRGPNINKKKPSIRKKTNPQIKNPINKVEPPQQQMLLQQLQQQNQPQPKQQPQQQIPPIKRKSPDKPILVPSTKQNNNKRGQYANSIKWLNKFFIYRHETLDKYLNSIEFKNTLEKLYINYQKQLVTYKRLKPIVNKQISDKNIIPPNNETENKNKNTISNSMNQKIQKNKVFIITGGYSDVVKNLTERGWVKEKNIKSLEFDYIWTLKTNEINFLLLKDYQLCNHYFRNGQITRKSGLSKNIKNLYFKGIDPMNFFPRCYDLSIKTELEDFKQDFKFTWAISLLKLLQKEESEISRISKTSKKFSAKVISTAVDIVERNLNLIQQKINYAELRNMNRKIYLVTDEEWDIIYLPELTQTSNVQDIIYEVNSNKPGGVNNPIKSINKTVPKKIIRKPNDTKNMLINIQKDQVGAADTNKFSPNLKSITGLKSRINQMNNEEKKNNSKPNENNIYALGIKANNNRTNNTKIQDPAVFDDFKEKISMILETLEKFLPQYKLNGYRNIWIMKPSNLSRGRGVTCVDSLLPIEQSLSATNDTGVIVQKYIENPLVINQRKFDIRQWVLVTSLNPLIIWMWKEPYIRFGAEDYIMDDLNNIYSHLTNNSIAKHSAQFKNETKFEGDMWTCQDFSNYLREGKWKDIHEKIKNAVICSFYAAHHEIKQRENSHELYGYDFMIDEDFNVYLIEVNASPALDYSTKITENAVKTMVKDLIEIVIDNNNGKNFRVNSNGEGRTNNKFVQIFNENRDNINIPKNVPNKNMFY